MSNDKSTPKWGVHTGRSGTIYVMDNKALETVAEASDTWGKGMTNSELIARAVNSHDALVEALEKMVEHVEYELEQDKRANNDSEVIEKQELLEDARAALALAKGE